MPQFLRYRDDLEQPTADEAETIKKIIDVMTTGTHNVRKNTGVSARISHAKAYAFVKGELIVPRNLPPELAQGLFAQAGTHGIVVRMAQVPGEMLDDRKVTTPNGMSIKVLDVEGTMLPGHEGNSTQDFVIDSGSKAFIAPDAKSFLLAFTPNATIAPKLPDAVKGVVSTGSRAANAVLSAIGFNSAKLDFYGHPPYHPLGEEYYSQVPMRYGDYVAKLSVTPANAALESLVQQKVTIEDQNGWRLVVADYFKTNEAVFNVNIQLATDEKTTPIEDATVAWPEDVSPYRTVAQLVLPPQNSWDEATQKFVDYQMSFSPGHSLAAHRPLGGIQRARLAVYPVLSKLRHAENGQPMVEPQRLSDVPQ